MTNPFKRRRPRCHFFATMFLALCAAMLPVAAAAQQEVGTAETFEAIRAADLQLARIGYRIATANAELCEQLEPGTGLQLHSLDLYDGAMRSRAEAHFGFATDLAIEAVVPGSPAEAAGLQADDSLVRIGPVVIAGTSGRPNSTERLVQVQLALAELPPEAPVEVEALRDGVPIRATILPVPRCRSRFELRLADDLNASADGTMVQLSSRYLEDFPEEFVAATVAHELSHNILRHRVRLEARGVSWGLLSGFGGNVKYFRQTEVEADLLAVSLLVNAGYGADTMVRFWSHFGPRHAGGILRSRTHPSWRDRVATVRQEAMRVAAISARPVRPPILEARDRPLDGDWQSLLVRD